MHVYVWVCMRGCACLFLRVGVRVCAHMCVGAHVRVRECMYVCVWGGAERVGTHVWLGVCLLGVRTWGGSLRI